MKVVKVEKLKQLFLSNKESKLCGRYIHNNQILPIIKSLPKNLSVNEIGRSVLNKPIYSIQFGTGNKKILMWSQMHGNESTTTKAVFDLLNTFLKDYKITNNILRGCTICIIPILNPDGAENYTRLNANNVDLNRDANKLSQPESKLLRGLFDQFKPDFCFNLHGQRTIFSAGITNKPATISFLAPAQDRSCSITDTRKKAMEVILSMNNILQEQINNQVGIYDDSFNINCVGDLFQSLNAPTILFEAGHYQGDYQREKTRELIYQSLLCSLDYITNRNVIGENYSGYFNIPENSKRFYDIILRNTSLNSEIVDIAIQYEEILFDGNIKFVPRLKEKGRLDHFYGHREINIKSKRIEILDYGFEEGIEIVIVNKNQEKKVLNLKEF